jgi:hypothetical protein
MTYPGDFSGKPNADKSRSEDLPLGMRGYCTTKLKVVVPVVGLVPPVVAFTVIV